MGIIIKFVTRNIREKKLRTLLILFSIMMSSALYFATDALSDTAEDLFIQRMAVYFGDADLQVYPSLDSPSSFLSLHRSGHLTAECEYIVGSIEVNGTFIQDQETLHLIVKGFDLNELQKMNPFPLRAQYELLPFRGKKAIISRQTAESYGLKRGDYLEMEVLGAKRKFLIAALSEPVGPFQYVGQTATVIVPLDTLATILNARGKVGTLYAKAKKPEKKEELLHRFTQAYPRYQVRQTITGQELREYTKSLTVTFQMMGAVVLLISIYIIYTSFKVITRERLPMIGTFRSIGATKTLTNLVLVAESVLYGILGGLLGCLFGVGVLYLMIMQVRPEFMRTIPVTLQFSPEKLCSAFLLAIILALVSSIIPIIKTSKIPIKEVIFNTVDEIESKGKRGRIRSRIKPALGLSFIVLALIVPPHAPYKLFLPTALVFMIMSMIGFVLLVPALTNIFLKFFEGVYLFIFGNEGILAAKNLRGNKGILNNISLLALGISGLLMINTISFSVAKEVANFYRDGQFQIWFWTWQADRRIEAILRAVDGVEDTYGIYSASYVEVTNLEERLSLLHGVDEGKYLDYWDLEIEQPLLSKLETGRYILITKSLRERLQVEKGDVLTLKLARGERDYEIIGFFESLMDNGSFALVAQRFLKMDMNLRYYQNIYIKTHKDPTVVSAAIKKRMKRRDPWINTMSKMAADNHESNQRMFNVMQGFSVLAMVIGIFGVFNNLIISFIERQRSLAVFRSIGLSKAQSVKMFFIEALSGGLIGGTIGVLSGSLLLWIAPLVIKAVAADIPIHYSFPHFLYSVLAGLIITVSASTGPAFKSSNLNIVEAIKYE